MTAGGLARGWGRSFSGVDRDVACVARLIVEHGAVVGVTLVSCSLEVVR